MSRDAFLTEVARIRRQNAAAARKKETRDATAPLQAAQPKDRSLRFTNVRSAVAEEGVLALMCQYPEQFGDLPLTADDFTSPALGKLYEALAGQIGRNRSVSLAALSQQFSPEEMTLLTGICQRSELPAHAAEQAMKDYINKIQAEKDKAARGRDMRAYAEKLKQRKGYGHKDGS